MEHLTYYTAIIQTSKWTYASVNTYALADARSIPLKDFYVIISGVVRK
jgi:hypothetical protein